MTSKNKRLRVSQPPTFDLVKKMKLFEATGKWTEQLVLLYQSLLQIEAASAEAEQASP